MCVNVVQTFFMLPFYACYNLQPPSQGWTSFGVSSESATGLACHEIVPAHQTILQSIVKVVAPTPHILISLYL